MAVSRLSRTWPGLTDGVRRAGRKIPALLTDLAGFVGAASIAYGAWLIYPPAGFLVAGVLLVAGAMFFGRRLDARKE